MLVYPPSGFTILGCAGLYSSGGGFLPVPASGGSFVTEDDVTITTEDDVTITPENA